MKKIGKEKIEISIPEYIAVQRLKRYLDECDADELSRLLGDIFGGQCFFDIEKEEYIFEPNKFYAKEFDDFIKKGEEILKDYIVIRIGKCPTCDTETRIDLGVFAAEDKNQAIELAKEQYSYEHFGQAGALREEDIAEENAFLDAEFVAEEDRT